MFLLLGKYMLGSRTKIVLLTWFFTFAFGLLFLALVKSYTHAGNFLLASNSLDHEIVPRFWLENSDISFDLDRDDSFQKYLNSDYPFHDLSYIPTDLISIDSNFTANDVKKFKLRQEASIEFADMAWHFWNAFSGDRLYIVSAYRSKGLQDYLLKQGCSSIKCAQVGTSEHQAWLAVDLKVIAKWGRWYSLDLGSKTNKYYDWLKSNAADFWFHNTYQKGVEVDGKMVEWRHRRYLWTELATLLMQNDQTFAEYYNEKFMGD